MDINYQSVISEISTLLEVLGASGARKAVSEVFSPGRFVNQAGVFGMIPGSAYDLRTKWDLSDPRQQAACWDEVERDDPYLLIGSPICTASYSTSDPTLLKVGPDSRSF